MGQLAHLSRPAVEQMLLCTMCSQEQECWRAFDFLPSWHTLTPAQRSTKLQEHACHELHFFVHQRDPQLFQSAVLPLLQVRNVLDDLGLILSAGLTISWAFCASHPGVFAAI